MSSILDRYAHGAAERLDGPTFCSLTISDHGALHQIASNDPRAAACDQIETRDEDGPCIEAMVHLHSVYIDDIAALDRWSTWRQAALDSGFRSFVALPAYVSDDVTVAANVYCEELGTWTRRQFVAIDAYVQELASVVRTAPA